MESMGLQKTHDQPLKRLPFRFFQRASGQPLPAHPTEIKSTHYFFSENLLKPAIVADLLALNGRIESTQQLVYCSTLLLQGPASTNDKQELEWMAEMDKNPMSQDHLRWLVTRMVTEYAQDASKDSVKTAEIVALGPVLNREHYRKLLLSILGELDNARIVDFTLLHGLIQLIQSASPGFLEPDDLVRILRILRVRLEGIHEQSSEHTYYFALVISRVLDVMADHGVKDLDQVVEHEPLSGVLLGLKGSSNPYLMYQACYAFQALQYVPDDKTVLQAVLRHSLGVATSLVNTTAVFKLGLGAVLEGLENLQEALGETVKPGMTVYEGVSSLMESGQGVMDSLKEYYKSGKKRPWYAAIRAAHAFIQAGQLKDFNQLICEAPCRRDPLFQWGICQLLGEVVSDTIWDIAVRQQAVDFLGELYRNDQEWAQDESVKTWMLNIVGQLGANADQAVSTSARALLQELEQDQDAAITMSRLPYPLRNRLPLPSSSPILTRVQNIPYLEYDLNKLKLQRLDEYREDVYIPPQAKPSLQAIDDTSFPLMKKMDEFLAGPWQVFLILGDSGAGKSTFNHKLEHTLWQNYKRDGPIPLFISLPTIDNPAQDLIGKALRYQNFSEEQMRELKLHRQFIVICDGYDESQLKINLHSTNEFNQPGQWKAKMVVSCRSQYLGQDYRSRFQPRPTDHYACASPDLMMEAVIVPFSKAQIEQYVEQYVKELPADDVDRDRPSWTKEEYMEILTKIPKLLELVSNPFLLTLSLEALPKVIGSKKELSAIRITRVQLYDGFVNWWLEVNKKRLQDSILSESEWSAFNIILDDFLYHGIKFQKELAVAIFQKQEGQPVVSYTDLHDGRTWKSSFFSPDAHTKLLRESSTVTRSGSYFRFIHRSLLEYFYSRTIYDPLDCDADIASDDSPSISTSKSGLAQMSITNEPSIIQFLAERVYEDQTFKNKLHQVIELSKADSQASQAASNAISILIQAGVHFNGADLQGVRVPKADLAGGQFDSAQFQGADLTGANLTMSWIWQADFSNAQMAEVRFGELHSLQESGPVKCCAYSSDGQTFAVGLWNGEIRLYDTATWKKVRVFRGHKSAVSSISFSHTGNQVISSGDDSTVRIWDPQEGKVRRKALLCKATCVAFSPKDQHVALATERYLVGIWNVKSNEDFVLRGHTAPVTSVAWSPSGYQIASGSCDGTIRLWNSETWISSLVLNSIASPASRVCCIAYSPDGRRIVAGDDDGELKLWNSMTNELEHSMKGHYNTISGVTFSKDGQWIASCSYDKSVRLWDAEAHVGVSIMSGHLDLVYGVAFSPDNLQIASCSSDRTVRRWDVSTKGASLGSHVDPGEVSIVAYSLDGHRLNAMGAKIKDAVDLSQANRELLSQHGAIGDTLISESDESESDSESDESESDSESGESESDSESDDSESDSKSDESKSVSESDESKSVSESDV
ncbi:Telomerase protein component 1 [Mortierella sp. 14UC]|nr:Telomerase protein component 1 [Mortierella sp. 14UC]